MLLTAEEWARLQADTNALVRSLAPPRRRPDGGDGLAKYWTKSARDSDLVEAATRSIVRRVTEVIRFLNTDEGRGRTIVVPRGIMDDAHNTMACIAHIKKRLSKEGARTLRKELERVVSSPPPDVSCFVRETRTADTFRPAR